MRGDVDNQPQIAVRAAILPRRPLAFQADTLTIDYPGGIFTFSVFGVSLSIMPNTLYTGRL